MTSKLPGGLISSLQRGYIRLSDAKQRLFNFFAVLDLRLRGAKVGRGVRIIGRIDCRHGHGIEIHDRAVIGRGAKIIMEPSAKLIIGHAARVNERVLLTVKKA